MGELLFKVTLKVIVHDMDNQGGGLAMTVFKII
jgi:hypothetical protein